MSVFELVLVALGLSMDAFAVAVCKGLKMQKIKLQHALTIALFFGFFQAFMPLVGWLLGTSFAHCISAVDHWIVFILLVTIGGKMIIGTLKNEDIEMVSVGLDLRELFFLALATSIDALAVGISLAVLPDTKIFQSIGIIGVTTFVLSFLGVVIGKHFGAKYKQKAELFGGFVLVLIGIKVLIDHLI